MKMDPPFLIRLIRLIRLIHLMCLIYQLNVSRETFG
jgi:hypothetical protein